LRLVGSETLVTPIKAYTHRLHTRWPAGKPEKLPVVREDGATNVPGLDITGEEPDKAYNRLHDHKDFLPAEHPRRGRRRQRDGGRDRAGHMRIKRHAVLPQERV